MTAVERKKMQNTKKEKQASSAIDKTNKKKSSWR